VNFYHPRPWLSMQGRIWHSPGEPPRLAVSVAQASSLCFFKSGIRPGKTPGLPLLPLIHHPLGLAFRPGQGVGLHQLHPGGYQELALQGFGEAFPQVG